MIRALFSQVSRFHQRTLARFHRTDQLKADAAERRERWNQVIAEHQKPLEHSERTSRPSTGGAGSAGEARHD
jgi:hypothetical protein